MKARFLSGNILPPARAAQLEVACSNGFIEKARNATVGNPDIDVWSVDSDNILRLGGAATNPARQTVQFSMLANGSLADQLFFISNKSCYIHSISYVHSVAGNDAAAVSLQVKKVKNGATLAQGENLLSTAFNCKSTANVVQTGTLVANDTLLTLEENDALGVDFTGTLTTLEGVVVTVVLSPCFKEQRATFLMLANGGLADQAFYIATRPMRVVGAKCRFSTAGTNGSAVSLQVTKDTSTDAPGAGTDLLTNGTGVGFNLKGTINTVQEGALSATPADLVLAAGDRLSVDFAGTLTAVAGLVVEVELAPVYDRIEVTFNLAANASLADQAYWTADRDYKILDIAQVHSAAGTDGGGVTLQVTVDKTTSAPGAGTDTQSSGFNLKSTANTVQWATLVAARTILVQAGDRLAVDFAGVLTTVAGVVVTVAVEPV